MYIKNDTLLIEEFSNGDSIITDPLNNKTIFLNQTGTIIFNSCDGKTLEEIQGNLLKYFSSADVAIEELKNDVVDYLDRMTSEGIIVLS